MADLIGTATIRVDMPTAAAARSIRRMAAQAETPLRNLQRRVSQVRTELGRLRGTSVTVDISDRTAAGVASVRAAVTSLQRLGPVRIPVQINDGTRRGARTVQTTVASLQRLGPIRIGADIDVDPAAAANAASALRGLQTAASGAGRALGTLATRATTATAALTALGAAARSLRGDMDDLDGAVRRTGDGMNALRARLGTVTLNAGSAGAAMGGLTRAALLLSPALIPIAVQAAPIAASLTAATVALGAFGAAMGGQISKLSEAADAEKKYKDAIAEHGGASKEATDAGASWLRQLSAMPPQTRVAATSLSLMKDQYRDWSDSLASSTMPVATRQFQIFGALFPKLTPLVKGSSTQLMRFQDLVAGGMASPGFDRFMKSFGEFSTGVLDRANDKLVGFITRVNTGKVSGGVSEFMDYVRANGPLVRDTFAKLGQALGNIMEAASNVGPGLLTVVNALAGLVAAVPPGAITAMLQLALAMKAVNLAAAAMAAGSGRLAAINGAITAMSTAAAGATGPLGRMQAAIGALSRTAKVALAGTGIGLLVIAIGKLSSMGRTAPPDVDRLTASLGRLGSSGKVSGEAAKIFGRDLDQLYSKVRNITDPSFADQVQNGFVKIFTLGQVDSTASKQAQQNLDAIDDSLTRLVEGGKLKEAQAALDILAERYSKNGAEQRKFRAEMDEYNDAVDAHKAEMEIAARAMGIFGQQSQLTAAKLNAQKASADGLRQALLALTEVNRSAHDAQTQFEGAIDALTESFKQHGATLNADTEAGRQNRNAMSAAAAAQGELIASGLAAGDSLASMTGKSEKLRTEMMRLALEAFDGNKRKAQEYTNTLLGTPSEIVTLIKAEREQAITGLQEVQTAIKETPNAKSVTVSTLNAAAIAALEAVGYKTEHLPDGRTKVTTANGQAIGSINAVSNALNRLDGKTARTYTSHTVRTINEIITRSKTYRSVHDIVGATGGLFTGKDFKFRGKGYARGGLVDGPGTETSDDVFAPWLSKNEFVVNAKQTAKHLPLLKAINDGRFMAGGGMAGAGISDAGSAVGDGLAAGMAAATRKVEAAARQLAAAVKAGVREELQIASPSRAMKALAKDVGAGFISGLTGSRDKIKSVSKDLASDVRAAFTGKRETGLIKMINRDTSRLLSLASKRDSVAKKIADASKFATDTANQARSTGSLGTIVSDDHFSPRYVEGRMKASLNAIKNFTSNVTKLQKRGLNKTLLRQILEMGPEEGAAFAKTLAGADAATIKRFNSLQSQISGASSKLGKTGADMLFDSGKKASQGFLTGLKAQQKDIEKMMLGIAKAMQKSIKKALGIRSPSTVFAAIGRNIGDGLVVGLSAASPAVAQAAKKISAVATEAATAAVTKRKAQPAKAAPKTGFSAAVAELQRLVDTGKWNKKGSLLFEDISFQGMSKNFRAQQMKVADGFWAAVNEIKKAVKSGKKVFEDMTFKGMSSNVQRFHDVIAQLWKGNPYGRNFGDFGNFGKYKQYGKYAGGGLITGPGSGTADRIPIMASNREFMMQAAAVSYYGVPTMAALNRRQIPRSALRPSGLPAGATATAPVGDTNITVVVQNHGVIGSQIQMQDWLAKSLDNLARTGRLPAALRKAVA